ncbi:nucleolar protein,Nop52-domain-containing protein [Mycena floridula]|nr:nucleolar protein,Nop52-domain-containing protein [Mycena floridula]
MTATSTVPPLAKYLASTEKKTRDKAIKNLSVFLSDSSQDAIPKPEMIKLWKGLFYCFWMSDKPLVQQALATELAELVLTITTTSSSLAFLDGFWETTVREWSGIDRLRIDKYYMLVRRFINAAFRLLIRTGWETSTVEEYNRILTREGGPLCPTDIRVPTSLSYHLADIYIEELDKALGICPSIPVPLVAVLAPFFLLASRTPLTTTYKRVQSALLDPLFDALAPEDDAPPSAKRIRLEQTSAEVGPYPNLLTNACFSDPASEGITCGPEILKKLLRRIFEVASDSETRESSRKKMYSLWKERSDEP